MKEKSADKYREEYPDYDEYLWYQATPQGLDCLKGIDA